MAYTVGSKQVIKDDRTTQLNTVTVSTSEDYIEIQKTTPAVVGTNNGFISGISPATPTNRIQKFPYALSPAYSTLVGSLSVSRSQGASHTEGTAGFLSGGAEPTLPIADATQIDKYPFAITSGSSTDIGDLDVPYANGGVSGYSSSTDGYTSGLLLNPPGAPGYSIQKFPFAITSGTSSHHTINPSIIQFSGSNSSTENGYITGGGYASIPAPFDVNTTITKFPFASTVGITSVGNLSEKKEMHSYHNSETDGFAAGGNGPGPASALAFSIDKFPFSISSGTASSVGTLTPTSAARLRGSNSSTTAGFISGQGLAPPTTPGGGDLNALHTFPFSITSGDATRSPVSLSRLASGGQGTDD